jgi:hypothetical protein
MKTDLLPGASLFEPLVETVQDLLKERKCVLTEVGDLVLPREACFADSELRILLLDSPPGLAAYRLVHDERKRNHGYDLLAIKPGHVLRIEIKAHLREAKSVFVTLKEWKQSKERNGLADDDRWELWNVENLAADTGKVRITRYSKLPDSARTREAGYWVDLNACHSESVQG